MNLKRILRTPYDATLTTRRRIDPLLHNAERVAFLFELYHKYTSMLPSPEKPKQRKRKKT